MRILVAEDDPRALSLLCKYLEAKGYEVVRAADGSEALRRFFEAEPDLVLLDAIMPQLSGWEVLEEIRAVSQCPVMMVTVQNRTADKVRGLNAGCDDYVTKPFDLKEIEARIQAVLRRYRRAAPGERIRVGPLVIDDGAKQVSLRGRPVSLSPKEYEVLYCLALRPGKVLSSEEILAQGWPERDDATAEDVKKYIYFLRSKLEEDPAEPRLIRTVRGFGYKLEV